MAGNAEISWPHLRMRIEDNASFAHEFRILRYTGTAQHSLNPMEGVPISRYHRKPYANFRFGHKFSLMVVGPSVSWKSFFVKQMLERDHIEYDDPRKQRHIHWFMDNTKICLKV